MSTKKVMRLAALLEKSYLGLCSVDALAAATELRRQHAEIERLTAERDALRTALQRIVDWDAAGLALTEDHINQARAALQQPKEQSNG